MPAKRISRIPGRLFERGEIPNIPNADSDAAFVRKKRLPDSWKPRTLDRDGNRCRACKATTFLELAHNTPVVEFLRLEGVDQDAAIWRSYRDDNLLILCRWCHVAYDMNGRHDDPAPTLETIRSELNAAKAAPEIERHRQLRDEEMALVLNIFGYTQGIGDMATHHPPIYFGARLEKAKARLRALRKEIGEVGQRPPFVRWIKAGKAWTAAHGKVTRARRRKVLRIVRRIEEIRGWKAAADAPAALGSNWLRLSLLGQPVV